MLLKVQAMETPLEILSRAAQMVDNANAELLKVVGQRKVRSAVSRKHHKRNSGKSTMQNYKYHADIIKIEINC